MQGEVASQELLRRAAAALSAGDAAGAQAMLATHLGAGGALDRPGEFLFAQISSRLGDRKSERAALHRVLAQASRDIPALLAMGESYLQSGDARAASAWFTTALRQAAVTPPAQQIFPMLERASQFCRDTQAQFAQYFDEAIAEIGLSSLSPSMRYAVDMLRGQSELHLQQPSMFYYPGLPQRFFYERTEFSWVEEIEASATILRDELLGLMEESQPFAPYIETPENRPASSSPLLNDPDWGAAYLWRAGELQTSVADRCRTTMQMLSLAPQPVIPARSPMALYSRLRPGTHIAPHHGLLNTRLICHLPLVAPAGCALRVGAETREWRFGEMLIFDDSIEHEAWNRGSTDRTVLLFEIWRPEIADDERAILSRLFEAIDRVDPERGKEQA